MGASPGSRWVGLCASRLRRSSAGLTATHPHGLLVTSVATDAGSLTSWIVRKAEPAVGKVRPYLGERPVIIGRLRFHVKHRDAEKLRSPYPSRLSRVRSNWAFGGSSLASQDASSRAATA